MAARGTATANTRKGGGHKQPPENYYEATSGPRPQRPSLRSALDARVCVIGAGFAGLATALGLLERGVRDVVVLEAERVGFGASGRNGGFVLGGYSLGAGELADRVGAFRARALHALTRQAVDLMRRRIVRHAIDCDLVEGGALLVNWFDDDAMLRREQQLLDEVYGVQGRFIERARLPDWVVSERYSAGLLEPDAFHFHPLKYALGEAAAIESLGGRVFEDSPVTAVTPDRIGHRVKTAHGSVHAQHVVIAAGGYIGRLVPALSRAALPIATYVIATEPLGDELRRLIPSNAAIYDTRFAFDYYRRLNDTRLLWGGRISVRERAPREIARLLRQDMLKVFPSLENARVEYAWAGLMSYARHKMPQIGRLSDGCWHALGFGGHGVAPTTAAGELLAAAIAEGEPLPDGLDRFGLPRSHGVAGLAAAQAAYTWMQIKDRWKDRRAARARTPG